MTLPTIVFDTSIQQFQENRIFDHQHAAKFPGALIWAVFGERARERGWMVMTSDVFLRSRSSSSLVLCVSEMITAYTRSLLSSGVVPVLILSGESPNISWNFYHKLGKYSRPYHHAFLFRGAGTRISPPTQFHPLYWPNTHREVLPGCDWHDREYLVMIVSNKQRFAVSKHKPFFGERRFAKKMIWKYLQLIDPLFRFEDLYQRRLDAICYFADVQGFRLYGTGWDNPKGLSKKYFRVVQRTRAIPVDDKLKTMSSFKFALCFENCIFPGYVTEKIFDCFFAGCIPIYWGAPDIADFVPDETFIDARQFNSWVELDHYLRGMSESEWQSYRDATRDFLASKDFDKFHQDAFVNQLIATLESEIANAG